MNARVKQTVISTFSKTQLFYYRLLLRVFHVKPQTSGWGSKWGREAAVAVGVEGSLQVHVISG